MKSYLKILVLLLFPVLVNGQVNHVRDSLRQALKTATTDSAKYFISEFLGYSYKEDNADSSLKYYHQALLIARKNDRKIDEAFCLSNEGESLADLGRYVESFDVLGEALKIAEDPKTESPSWLGERTPVLPKGSSLHQMRLDQLGFAHFQIGLYRKFADSREQQIFHIRKALQLFEEVKDTLFAGFACWTLSSYYRSPGKLDSALTLLNTAEQIFQRYEQTIHLNNSVTNYLAEVYLTKGEIYGIKGDKKHRLYYSYKGLEMVTRTNNTNGLNWAYRDLANYYLQAKQKDSSLYYAKKNVALLLSGRRKDLGQAYLLLSKSYHLENENDSAYKYQSLALTITDSVEAVHSKNLSDFQKQSFKDQLHLRDLEIEKTSYQDRIRTNVLLGGLFTLLIIAFLLYRNNRQKQKGKKKIEQAYNQLKSTQSQLIQSEKMASLGELTAGIAHEIQNPLNFVNNFSELNKELIDELKEELAIGSKQSANEIANDIKDNEEKINHHGKRAESIVKGMLLHSRGSSGQKEPTDINALCDEYLRLSYHGFRAKDKSFNADFKLEADESVPKVDVVPQDIGRVLLNLINNAFYAVDKKAKEKYPLPSRSEFGTGSKGGTEESGVSYKPLVTIRTVSSKSPSGGSGGCCNPGAG